MRPEQIVSRRESFDKELAVRIRERADRIAQPALHQAERPRPGHNAHGRRRASSRPARRAVLANQPARGRNSEAPIRSSEVRWVPHPSPITVDCQMSVARQTQLSPDGTVLRRLRTWNWAAATQAQTAPRLLDQEEDRVGSNSQSGAVLDLPHESLSPAPTRRPTSGSLRSPARCSRARRHRGAGTPPRDRRSQPLPVQPQSLPRARPGGRSGSPTGTQDQRRTWSRTLAR